MRVAPSLTFVVILASIGPQSPAAAETLGLPIDRFATTWTTPPTRRFTPRAGAPPVRLVAVRPGAISDDVLREAFVSAANSTARRDLAIEEMANAFEPAQHAALEDLLTAQRAYAAAPGGDREERDAQFAALIQTVTEERGRSAAHDAVAGIDEALDATYARAASRAPDSALPALEASETAWTSYRDAFGRFAQAMDRPDAATALRDDLVRHRTDELAKNYPVDK